MVIHLDCFQHIRLLLKGFRDSSLDVHDHLLHFVIQGFNSGDIVGQSLSWWNDVQFTSIKLENQTRTLNDGTILLRELIAVQRIGDTTHDGKRLIISKWFIDHPIRTREDRSLIIPYHRTTRDSRTDIEKTKWFFDGILEVVEILWLYRNLNCDTILLCGRQSRDKCDSGHRSLIEVGIVDTLHAIIDACDGKVVRITEGRLWSKTQATDLIVGVGLCAFKVDRIDVVDILMGDTSTEILDGNPRLQRIRSMNMEGAIRLPCLHMGIVSVAPKLTDDGEGLVRVEIREDLKCFAGGTHLESLGIADVALLF